MLQGLAKKKKKKKCRDCRAITRYPAGGDRPKGVAWVCAVAIQDLEYTHLARRHSDGAFFFFFAVCTHGTTIMRTPIDIMLFTLIFELVLDCICQAVKGVNHEVLS